MIYDSFSWIDSAYGSLTARSNVTNLSEYRRILKEKKIGANPEIANYFRSYFRFERNFYEYFISKPKPSVAGFKGIHIFDFLYVDIDAENIQKAVQILGTAFEKVSKFGITVLCAFSGTKGFHLYIPAGYFRPTPDTHNFKYLKRFSRLLFGDLIDTSNYEINRLLRQPATLNRKPDAGRFGFKNFLKADEIQAIFRNPDSVFSICSAPSSYLVEEDLSIDFYWEFSRNDSLTSVWEQSKEESQKKRTVVHAGGWRAQGAPQCVSNILSMIKKNDPALDGWKNNAFAILTIYFKNQIPVESALRKMLHDLNDGLERPHDPKQLDATISSVLRHDYSGWGCGSEESSFGALYFCNGESKLSLCPKFIEAKDAEQKKDWTDSAGAFEKMLTDLKAGPTNINLGIKEFDEVYHFLKPGDTIIFIGVSTVGKSILMYRLMRHWVEVAKKRDEIVVFSLPEQNDVEAAKRVAMQLGGFTLEDLYEKASNGGLPENIRQWFLDYKDHLVFQHAVNMTVDEWKTVINRIEEINGKKVMLAFFDGIKFLSSPQVKGFNRFEDMGKDIVSLANEKQFVVAVNHHVPKMDMKTKTPGMDETQIEPSMYSGFGSSNFADMFTYVFTLYRDGNRNLCVRMRKSKQIWGRYRKLPTVKFFVLDSYNVLTAKEIEEKNLIGEFPEEIINDIQFELMELEANNI